MKKLISLLLCLTILTALASCKTTELTRPEDTEPAGDWRNKIEYEGNFYVNRDTKLLYALDKGTITLWDSNGDGKVLQTLDYSSAESDAIESIEIKDVNLDGHNDIINTFAKDDKDTKYNLWLWNNSDKKFVECKLYRGIPNPVVSEDGKSVTGYEDKGVFGKLETHYVFTDTLALELSSVIISNADTVAADISADLADGAPLTKAEGSATIEGFDCKVYAAEEAGKQTVYIAYSSSAYWYIDRGCVGVYKMVENTNGTYTAGGYVSEAGEMADLCAQLYSCDVSMLEITKTTLGEIASLSYDEEGNIIPLAEDEIPTGMQVTGYSFSKDGEHLCVMLKAENSSYYCLDPKLSGDDYYYMVSAAGETKLVPMTASVFRET